MGAACLVLAASAWIGWEAIKQRDIESTIGLEPALAIGLGLPFGNVDMMHSPSLRAFLFQDREVHANPPRVGPDDRPLTVTEHLHRHLYTLVGTAWRWFGLSWDVVRGLLVAFLCVSALAGYGVFRLGMPTLLALPLTLLWVHGLTPFLPHLRDFSKIPFLVVAIFCAGLLLKAPRSRSFVLGLAFFAGLAVGAGTCFRSDVLIGVPLLLLAVLFCRMAVQRVAWLWRTVAISLLLGGLCVGAWPTLTTAYTAGSPVAMHVLDGISCQHTALMHQRPASYEKKYAKWDALTLAVTTDYGRRTMGMTDPIPFQSPKDAAACNGALAAMAWRFPADFVSCAYSASIRLLQLDTYPILEWLGYHSYEIREKFWALWMLARTRNLLVFFAAAALLFLAWRDARTAWGVLLCGAAFLGVYSLQFEMRHFFYLALLPLWLLGFWISSAGRVAARVWRRYRARSSAQAQDTPATGWKGFAGFVLGVLVLFTVPLVLLRAHQEQKVSAMAQCFDSLPTAPLRVEMREFPDAVSVRLVDPLSTYAWYRRQVPHYRFQHCAWEWRPQVLMAEFADVSADFPMYINYDYLSGNMSHVDQTIPVAAPTQRGNGRVRCYFPVYECPAPEQHGYYLGTSRFAGIVIPKELAPSFRGLYRCTGFETLDLLPCFHLPGDVAKLRTHLRLGSPFHTSWRPPAALAMAAGEEGREAAAIRPVLAQDPRNPLRQLVYARALADEGRWEAARDALGETLDRAPDLQVVYMRAEEMLARRLTPAQRTAFWRNVAARHDRHFLPFVYWARALEEEEKPQAAANKVRQSIARNLRQPALYAYLGHVLEVAGDYGGALRAHEHAEALAPDHGDFAAGRIRVLAKLGAGGAAMARYRAACAGHPELIRFFTRTLWHGARHRATTQNGEDALVLLRFLVAQGWREVDLYHTMANLHWQRGNVAATVAACREAIAVRPYRLRPCTGLQEYTSTLSARKALAIWNKTARSHAESAPVHYFRAKALLRLERTEEALDALQRAEAARPTLPVRERIGTLRARLQTEPADTR